MGSPDLNSVPRIRGANSSSPLKRLATSAEEQVPTANHRVFPCGLCWMSTRPDRSESSQRWHRPGGKATGRPARFRGLINQGRPSFIPSGLVNLLAWTDDPGYRQRPTSGCPVLKGCYSFLDPRSEEHTSELQS